MTNENNVALEVVNGETVEAAPKKRTRKPVVVKTITAGEIIAEVNKLETEVAELEQAITTIEPSNIIYQLIEKTLNGKRKELEDALDAVYKI